MRKYLVTVGDTCADIDAPVKVSMTVEATKPSRVLCKVLKHNFLDMRTSDDRSIYTCAPKDNIKKLTRYLNEALLYIYARVERVIV